MSLDLKPEKTEGKRVRKRCLAAKHQVVQKLDIDLDNLCVRQFVNVKPEADVTSGAAFVVARDRYGDGPQLGFGSSLGFGLGLLGLLGLLKGFRELLRGLLGLFRGEAVLLRSLGEETEGGAVARCGVV